MFCTRWTKTIFARLFNYCYPTVTFGFEQMCLYGWWRWLFVLVLQFQKILNFYIQRTRVLYPTCQQAAWGWAWSSLKYPSSSITYVQQAAWGADRGRVSGEKRRFPGATSINNHIIDIESYSRSQREYIQINFFQSFVVSMETEIHERIINDRRTMVVVDDDRWVHHSPLLLEHTSAKNGK